VDAALPDPAGRSVDNVPVKASEKASRYEWTEAAGLYKQVLDGLEPNDNLETGKVADSWERAVRAAFQSEREETVHWNRTTVEKPRTLASTPSPFSL
jgi:hypothetical protein